MKKRSSLDRDTAVLLLNVEQAEAELERVFDAIERAEALGFGAEGLWSEAVRLDQRVERLSSKL